MAKRETRGRNVLFRLYILGQLTNDLVDSGMVRSKLNPNDFALQSAIGANQPITIDFSKTLRAASANGNTVRAKRGANTINITIQTAGARLTIIPPGAGWGTQDFRVEIAARC